MGVFTDHPHTAITERVNSIVRDEELTPEIEIPELLGLINLQYYGPTEAARAIRKKLKYGNKTEKPRALEVLHLIVVNGGSKLAELYNDRKLLEYLRILANDQTADMELRKKVIGYAILWNEEFQGQKEYTGIASLKKQLPKVKRVKRRNDYFMDDEALSDDESSEAGSSSMATSHSSSRPSRQSTINPNDKYRIPKINLQKEGPKIKALIAEASKSSIDLINALRTINRSRGDKSTDDSRCTQLFEKSRIIRRRILRYLQLVESEDYLGSLIHANEELVDALQLYTEYASSPNADSDSDDYSSLASDSDDESDTVSLSESLASRMIEQHERSKISSNNDPFSDFNRVDESADWK
jgi:hypothetical protein